VRRGALTPEPVFVWHDVAVYLPVARRAELIHFLLDNTFPEVGLARGVAEPKEGLSAQWRGPPRSGNGNGDISKACDRSRSLLRQLWPGDGRIERHARTGRIRPRGWCSPCPPAHTLRATLEMPADAWRLDNEQPPDGVEVTLFPKTPKPHPSLHK
jgi:hypothetical protein